MFPPPKSENTQVQNPACFSQFYSAALIITSGQFRKTLQFVKETPAFWRYGVIHSSYAKRTNGFFKETEKGEYRLTADKRLWFGIALQDFAGRVWAQATAVY